MERPNHQHQLEKWRESPEDDSKRDFPMHSGRGLSSLASMFQKLSRSSGKCIDFVFANAGVIEKTNCYATKPDDNKPPPEPHPLSVNIGSKGVISTH